MVVQRKFIVIHIKSIKIQQRVLFFLKTVFLANSNNDNNNKNHIAYSGFTWSTQNKNKMLKC